MDLAILRISNSDTELLPVTHEAGDLLAKKHQ